MVIKYTRNIRKSSDNMIFSSFIIFYSGYLMLFILIEDFSILFNNNTDFHFGILTHTKESLSGKRG